MDQDSFRRLLQTPAHTSNTPRSPGSGPQGNTSSASSKSKTVDASKPLFKPRKVKKAVAEGKYRDRAAERREGGGNDYAHVEAVLEDFERRNANNEDRKAVEEQRKYLGGDSEHSILIKGLDMALLEQNKARVALESTEDDDTLEQAYLEASSAVPKKRTREDLLKELKQKRAQQGQQSTEVESEGKTKRTAEEEARLLEEAKKQGKFKPIGFKHIGGSEEKEKKEKKKLKTGESTAKEGEERKKKKRKVEGEETKGEKKGKAGLGSTEEAPAPAPVSAPEGQASVLAVQSQKVPESEPEDQPLGDEFDIFAGAGDYEGINFDDEDEEDGAESKPPESNIEQEGASQGSALTTSPKKWISTDDDEAPAIPSEPTAKLTPLHDSKGKARSDSPNHRRDSTQGLGDRDVEMEDGEEREHEEEEKPIRLQPLESSTLPSIRDFLAMDEAAEAAEKRRKRKEKKKKAGGGSGNGTKSMEAKVNRDFQRLQSYTSKKDGSGS